MDSMKITWFAHYVKPDIHYLGTVLVCPVCPTAESVPVRPRIFAFHAELDTILQVSIVVRPALMAVLPALLLVAMLAQLATIWMTPTLAFLIANSPVLHVHQPQLHHAPLVIMATL